MRMMQKMGMKIDEIQGVSEVIIRTSTKDIVIDEPEHDRGCCSGSEDVSGSGRRG